jgi:ArsR family transcriptional regulator
LLKALADPERLRIVQCLQQGPSSVSEVADRLGKELTKVSHHLGVLRNAGFVVDCRRGKQIIYSLHPEVFVPSGSGPTLDVVDLGCCRVELRSVRKTRAQRPVKQS